MKELTDKLGGKIINLDLCQLPLGMLTNICV